MPDNIVTVNGEAAMAYQNETPWHKLGTQVGEANVPQMMAAAKLAGWSLTLEDLFLQDGTRLKNRRAVRRGLDKRVLSVVGANYPIIQNEEAFDVLAPACEQFGVTIETAGALGAGDRVWMLAKMPSVVEPVAGDKVEGYFLVATGHNGWTPYSARLTPVRVVCANTFALAMRDHAVIRLTHVKSNVEKIAQVQGMVTELVAALKQTGESFAKLAARKLSDKQLSAYVRSVLGATLTEEMSPVLTARHATILELVKTGKGAEFAPQTAWAALNAVTEYVDHVRPAEVKSPKTLAQANQSALFGPNARVKQRALMLAQKLAA